jgi:hypothetical protein
MTKVILKLSKENGEDYGYIALGAGADKNNFVGGASKANATCFEKVNYPKLAGACYYKVNGSKYYMDEHTKGGEVFPDNPAFSIDVSSIHAWYLTQDKELRSVIGGVVSSEKLSLPRNKAQEEIAAKHHNAIFCNALGGALLHVTEEPM